MVKQPLGVIRFHVLETRLENTKNLDHVRKVAFRTGIFLKIIIGPIDSFSVKVNVGITLVNCLLNCTAVSYRLLLRKILFD